MSITPSLRHNSCRGAGNDLWMTGKRGDGTANLSCKQDNFEYQAMNSEQSELLPAATMSVRTRADTL
eukprot:1070579-Amphidinium_carterae.1